MPQICTPIFGDICNCSNGSGNFSQLPRSPDRVIIGVTTFSLHIAQVGCSSGLGSFNFFVFSSMEVDVFRTLCLDATLLLSIPSRTVYPYMFFHRPSWGWSYDGLASTAAGIQAVVETDSSHLQVQASNILHICACTAVNAHERGLVNLGEDAEASSAKHISFLQHVYVFKIKCSTRIEDIREWKHKPPPLNTHHASCQHKDPLHFTHILEMLCQGLSATYFQAHKAWMSTNVWAEQHLLALFGEGLLCLVVLGTVTSMRSIVAVVLSSIISYIIQNNGANLAHRCRLLAFFS